MFELKTGLPGTSKHAQAQGYMALARGKGVRHWEKEACGGNHCLKTNCQPEEKRGCVLERDFLSWESGISAAEISFPEMC